MHGQISTALKTLKTWQSHCVLISEPNEVLLIAAPADVQPVHHVHDCHFK